MQLTTWPTYEQLPQKAACDKTTDQENCGICHDLNTAKHEIKSTILKRHTTHHSQICISTTGATIHQEYAYHGRKLSTTTISRYICSRSRR